MQHRTVFLNPVAKVAAQGRGEGAFWMLPMPSGRIISLYPIALPILVAPLYVPAVGYLHWRGWTDARLDYVAKLMEKLTASLLAALSASLLYLLLRRRTAARNALLLTIAYAFGTTTWTISSQALWQHGIAQLLVIVVLLLLTGPCSMPRALIAGLLCSLIACNRPPDVVLAAVLGIQGLYWAGRRRSIGFVAAAALPALLVLFYNLHFGGNFFGGYGVIGKAAFFSHPLFQGIAGLLVSPTHGLLIFSPFLIFLVLAIRHHPHGREERILTLVLLAGVVLQILLYAKVDWRAGLSWGPRYLTDLLPFLILMLVPVVEALRRVGRAIFLIAVGVSIVVQAIGAFYYNGWIDLAVYAIEGPQKMDAAFEWRNASFLTAPKRGLAAPDLALQASGSFDAVEVGGRVRAVINAGEEAAAAGWALAGDRTPSHVAVTIDGKGAGFTSTFTDRPDVRAALHATAPSGWRIPIDTTKLSPGEHRLTAMVWTFPNGEGHYLAEKTLIVQGVGAPASNNATNRVAALGEEDLEDDFRKASSRISEHQQPEGFWLTAYTSGPRFVDSRPEMNTFLTSLLVDLLDPLEPGSGLEENVQRARSHLGNQIETGGLVRYHGRPDAPWIGKLGCAITPDTDDTALVWRIAPSQDRTELAKALATIDQYRTSDGLYRSWLAPREAYQCLDPGRDPNPTDIAIQMHLLMLLAEERPPRARALCDALRRNNDDDRIWVYYRQTPLVPILRLGDLRDAGCELTWPESRMRTDIETQAIWLTVARMLTSASSPGSSPPDGALKRAVLRELARNDFALLRMNPPLLYHNDLTATVPRYYWSEDVGYALWLRLYQQYGQQRHPSLGN